MGFNSAFKELKLLKIPENGRLNNLNDPSRPQCIKVFNETSEICAVRTVIILNNYAYIAGPDHVIHYYVCLSANTMLANSADYCNNYIAVLRVLTSC